eukprot:tig00020801_g13880.t1
MCKIDRMISLAALHAQMSEMRQPHGAVLVAGGKVLGVGANQNRLSRLAMAAGVCSVHAELNALSCFGSRVEPASVASGRGQRTRAAAALSALGLRNACLYVVRVRPPEEGEEEAGEGDALLAFSRPCADCLREIAARGIRRVVFSTGRGRQWDSAKVADLLDAARPCLSSLGAKKEGKLQMPGVARPPRPTRA